MSARMSALGLSQSELARRVGITQQTIYKLLIGASRGTTRIARLARELETTPAYLEGETDDPAADALIGPQLSHDERQLVDGARDLAPADRAALLRVTRLMAAAAPLTLPSEMALHDMFVGLLRPFALAQEDVLARTLARQLPRGLRLLQGPLIEEDASDASAPEAAEALPNDHRAPRRARRK